MIVHVKYLLFLPAMEKIWRRSVLLLLLFYLTPSLELDAEEGRANYANECHQYLNNQGERYFIAAKTLKQSDQQALSLSTPACLLESVGSTFNLRPEDPLSVRKVFLLHSVLII